MTTIDCGFAGPTARDLLIERGPTLYVDIGFDPAWRAGRVPAAGKRRVPAQVDTGAIECFIDCDLAAELRLPITDRREIAGSIGSHEVDVYMAQVHVPSLGFTMYGQFAGVYLLQGGQDLRVLMGRTFLANFRLNYNGRSGKVTLTI
jgi:hypothetical protein